jgi:excisionase family DNA binding protein
MRILKKVTVGRRSIKERRRGEIRRPRSYPKKKLSLEWFGHRSRHFLLSERRVGRSTSSGMTITTRFPGELQETKLPVYPGMLTNINDSDEPYLTLREIAERFSCKERTVREWLRYDDFPALRLPGEWRIRLSDFATWLERFQARKGVE